jgi:hypothetical protein
MSNQDNKSTEKPSEDSRPRVIESTTPKLSSLSFSPYDIMLPGSGIS